MPRKRKADGDSPPAADEPPAAHTDGAATAATEAATMPEAPPTTTAEAPTTESRSEAPDGQGEKKKPAASWKCNSDRTTLLEVAVWANEVSKDGASWTQYAATVRRSYRGQDGRWHDSSSYRQHDIPVLLFLLDKAHAWCLSVRTEDSTIPF
jgi:hypothetical protein